MDNLNKAIADVQKVTGQVAGGGGTIGRLLKDESLYDDFRRTVNRLDAIAVDLQNGRGQPGNS